VFQRVKTRSRGQEGKIIGKGKKSPTNQKKNRLRLWAVEKYSKDDRGRDTAERSALRKGKPDKRGKENRGKQNERGVKK